MNDLTSYLRRLCNYELLSKEEMKESMELMLNSANIEQTSAFLTALKMRGEKPDELIGMFEAISTKSKYINISQPILDIVGTGGDFANTVNISTGSAIVSAACGIPIVKHGSRSVSSQCGSADVLEALGIAIEMSAEKNLECLKENNIAFLYAPLYHPLLNNIKQTRKSLKIPTALNLICPLLNPANPQYALIGVSQESYLEIIADTILQAGKIKSALIFHGNGIDELSTLGMINAYRILDGQKHQLEINPVSLGFSLCQLHELQGGDIATNAILLKEALSGKKNAISDALLLNAGTALMIYGVVSTMNEGVERARIILNEGKAYHTLEKWVQFSKQIHTQEKII